MTTEFKLHPQKTVEVVAMFLKLHEQPMHHLGLIKLLYMSDRLSLAKFGSPVTGDRYVSMPFGPVLSGVYDLIKYREISNYPEALKIWSKYISRRNNYKVQLLDDPGNDEYIISQVYADKGSFDRFDLVDITHKQFPEWKDPHGSSNPINVTDILRVVGKTEKQVEVIQRNMERENFLDSILNYA